MTGGSNARTQSGEPIRRRRRKQTKPGKRSRPEEYGQANVMVRRGVLERLDQARADPRVRRGLEIELRDAGIEFKDGDPDFGALYEMLILEWLESVGYGASGAR